MRWKLTTAAMVLLLCGALSSPGLAFKKRGYFRADFSYGYPRSDRVMMQLSDTSPEKIFGLFEANIELDHTFWKKLRLYTDTSAFFLSQNRDVQLRFNAAIIEVLAHNHVEFWVGKRRRAFSPGVSFTPSDVFNAEKNPMDPSLQREGRYGAGISFPFDNLSFEVVWAPYEEDNRYGLPRKFDFTRNTVMARLYLNYWKSDINVMYANVEKKSAGAVTFSRYLVEGLMEFHVDVLLQQDRRSPLLETMARTTASLGLPGPPPLDNSGLFVKALAGFRFDFLDNKGNVTLEYYYNGAALKRSEFVTVLNYLDQMASLKSAAKLAGVTIPTLDLGTARADQLIFGSGFEGQQHLLISVAYRELWEVLTPSLAVIWSIDDGSVVIFPRVEWRIYDNIKLELAALIPIGGRRTEIGQVPYHVIGIARVWVYY